MYVSIFSLTPHRHSQSHHKDAMISINWLGIFCWFLQRVVYFFVCVGVCVRACVCVRVWVWMDVCEKVGETWVFVRCYTNPISSNPTFNGRIGGSLMAKAETHSLTIDLCLDRSEQGIVDWANAVGFSWGRFTDQTPHWLAKSRLSPSSYYKTLEGTM